MTPFLLVVSRAVEKHMSTRLSFDELLAAFEWVSAGEAAALDCNAYVSTVSGKVHWSGEGVDEELPEDIEDGSVYVAIPRKAEFDLGRSLALRFVEEHLPQSYETVHQFFRKRGAYSHFKALLERAGQLEAWHEYEQKAIEEALRQWSEEHGLTIVRESNESSG
jgi:hypothetical protein